MIVDKLLAFAEGKAIATTCESDAVDAGGGDEVARTLNLVAQLDDCAAATPAAATVAATLQTSDDGETWRDAASFPAVKVSDCQAGARVVPFAKLPLGIGRWLRVRMTVASGPLAGAKWSAWLTPSAEAELK